ncbi:MAG: TetR/AcrR family transcriptional regulator [Gemmatimonadetes bacterium]|nr:TetR/AcrR family transcriptional regulator [Gemmatimonadota bacterium]
MSVPKPTSGAKTPGPRLARVKTQKKLDDVLNKAAALIARKGFEAATMRDLGKAIDSSLAGLYYYFSSKEDLLFQLQYRTFLSLLESQREIAAIPGTSEERFARMVTGHLEFYARHTNELKACTFELESLSGKPYEKVEAIRREYYQLMASVVGDVMHGASKNASEARKARHASLFIFGMLNWIFMWYDPARHGTVEQIGREMQDLVLNGIRRKKRSG